MEIAEKENDKIKVLDMKEKLLDKAIYTIKLWVLTDVSRLDYKFDSLYSRLIFESEKTRW